jgi:hypothetical protein
MSQPPEDTPGALPQVQTYRKEEDEGGWGINTSFHTHFNRQNSANNHLSPPLSISLLLSLPLLSLSPPPPLSPSPLSLSPLSLLLSLSLSSSLSVSLLTLPAICYMLSSHYCSHTLFSSPDVQRSWSGYASG